MSAQVSALIGVIIGALLAGAGNLLLAWRDETIQARTGVILIRKILKEALAEVGRLRGKPIWNPRELPSSKLWSEYRAAVSARLSMATLEKIDLAMRRLDQLNWAAEQALDSRARRQDRIWKATEAAQAEAAGEGKQSRAAKGHEEFARQLMSEPSPMILTAEVRGNLKQIEEELWEARKALDRVSPSGEADRTRNPRAFPPWFRWHWRSFVASAAAIVLIGAAAGVSAGSGGTTAAGRVQDALASHLGEPQFTSCEATSDHEGEYSCVVTKPPSPTSCEAATASSNQRAERILVSKGGGASGEGCKGLVRDVLDFEAITAREDDCIVFLQTGMSNSPTGLNPSSPGFQRAMKAKLRKQAHIAEGVPPVVVPGADFTEDC